MNKFLKLFYLTLLLLAVTACERQPDETAPEPQSSPVATATSTSVAAPTIPAATKTTAPAEPLPTIPAPATPAPAPTTVPVPATATAAPATQAAYMVTVADFLTALQSGPSVEASSAYLSQDLQAAILDGRPLPALVGVRDYFPDFVLTNLTGTNLVSGALVQAQINYDVPIYLIFRLIEGEDGWRINNIGQHNLVRYVSSDLLAAELMIINYYQALATDQLVIALALLTAEAKESFTADALAPIATGLRRVTVTTLQPIRVSQDEIIFYVRLHVTPNQAQPGPWQVGDNPRWITMRRTAEGWRVGRIINSPILAEIKSWQRINVLPINMTLDIPADWTRPNLDWSWSPASTGLPAIGVRWADLGEFGGDETLLPRNRQSLGERPIDLGWAHGIQYSFLQMGGIGEGPVSAQTHIIVQTGRRAYNFYAVANNETELDNLRPILQRMVAAVVLYDPGATAFHSIETASVFLASLLSDPSGSSSSAYLSEELQLVGSDRQAILSLLAVNEIYSSYQVSWLENTAAGQARVLATLYLPGQELAQRQLTLQKSEQGQWLIISIEVVNN